MFSGIIETIGKVVEIVGSKTDGFTMRLKPVKAIKNINIGDSISVSGACLTVVSIDHDSFSVFVSKETIERTKFGSIKIGDIFNLETPLHLGSPISGHFVQGHIDGIGIVKKVRQIDETVEMTVEIAPSLIKYISSKGSIAVEGVSLTVTELSENTFSTVLIPYTIENTNLRFIKAGDLVNIEVDVIARYIESLIKNNETVLKREITKDFLFEHGFMEDE